MTLISCRQLAPSVGELTANAEMATAAVRSALDERAALVVLPELVTSGYVFSDRAEAESLAIASDHWLFARWSEEARRGDAVVVGGFCERAADGRLYNSAAVVDGSGLRAVYRKTHLWYREKLWFEHGAALPPVLDTAVGRIGVAICYDLEFPEITRHLAVAGADLIAVPTNWPLVDRPPGERPPEVVIAMAAARSNRIAIACCDRTGTERGQKWTGGSTIIGADGWPLAVAGDDDVATGDVDLEAARDKRLSDMNDALDDRRIDLYGGPALAAPTPANLVG
jgi:predicted amidohydrolase